MASIKINKQVLVVAVVVLVSLLGFLQLNVPFSQWRYTDDYPPLRNTVDPFIYTWHARQVYENEDAIHLTNRIAGLEQPVITTYPPLQGILTASLTKLTDVHVHHMEWFMIVLESIFVPISFFVLVRRAFNEKVALLALVLGLFAPPIYYFKTYIGHWGDVISFFFVPAILLLLLLSTKEKSTVAAGIAGVLIAAMFYGHGSEFLYMLAFSIGWIILLALWRKDATRLIQLASLVIVFSLVTLHFAPLLWNRINPEKVSSVVQKKVKVPAYYPELQVPVWILSLAGIGVIALILLALGKKFKEPHSLIVLFLLCMVAVSSTYVFMGYRLFRQFYSAYFLGVVLAAFGAYFIISQLMKLVNLSSFVLLVVLGISLLSGVTLFKANYAHFSRQGGGSIVDNEQWEGIQWIKKNTPENSKILALNGFIHTFPEYWIDRDTIHVHMQFDSHLQNIQNFCNGIYPENVNVLCGMFGEGFERGTYITKRMGWNSIQTSKGPFCAEYPQTKIDGFKRSANVVPIDYADYVLLQYRNTGRFVGKPYDGCMAFYMNESLARGNEIVWSNAKMAVIKVNKNGPT